MNGTQWTRRDFARHAGSCAAHLALAATAAPLALRRLWAAQTTGSVLVREPFGRLERVAEGIWALISTPLSGDRTTLSNGGLIAGRNGLLAIEGFMMPAGASWLAARARELTGRQPSHVVVTHYHGDHANGVAGYVADGAAPMLRCTAETRDAVLSRNQPLDDARSVALRGTVPLDSARETTIDLGGRIVRIVPRTGHTSSDVTIEIDEPSVVFCGDLVWNAMFPNYVDARPSELARSVSALRRTRQTIYVPGHGSVATEADVARYAAMLGEVETAARTARTAGIPAAAAGSAFTLPESLGEWTLFNRVFFQRAFEAWYRELP